MASFTFRHIDLASMFGEQDECAFVSDAISKALLAFRSELSAVLMEGGNLVIRYTVEDVQARRMTAKEDIERLLRIAEKHIRKAIKVGKQEDDWWDFDCKDEWKFGALTIDMLELGDKATLAEMFGESVTERQLLAAVVLMQCERCIDAFLRKDPLAVGHLMWDISELICELNFEDDMDEAQEMASARATALNRKRHAKRDAHAKRVQTEWEIDPSRFASAAAAGRHYADVLASEGHEYEPNTVRDWIRAHAKAKGIRLR